MWRTLARAGMWAGLAILLGAGAAHSADLPAGVDSSLVLEQFDIASDSDMLLVPVVVKGKKYLFAIDTGSTWTVYDVSLRPLLREPKGSSQADAVKERITVERFTPPAARLGKLALSQEPVVVFNLRKFQEVSGQPVQGVLGMDFLSKYVLCLDFDDDKVLFLRSPGTDPGHCETLIMQNNNPKVEGYLSDSERPALFLVDTGNGGMSSGVLSSNLATVLLRYGRCRKIKESHFCDASGDHVQDDLQLSSLTLGPFQQRDLVFNTPALESSLGLSYWSRFLVTFDFPHRKLYLKKSRHFNCPQPVDVSGLHILRRDGKTIAEVVDPDSPAVRCGIQAQDELLEIDGKPTATTPLQTLRYLLCTPRKSVPVVVRRGSHRLQVSLRLGDWGLTGQEKGKIASPTTGFGRRGTPGSNRD